MNPFELIPEANMHGANGRNGTTTLEKQNGAALITPPRGMQSYAELVATWAEKLGINPLLRLVPGDKARLVVNTGLTAEQVKTGLEVLRRERGVCLRPAKGQPRPGKPAEPKQAPAEPKPAAPGGEAASSADARALGLEIARELYAMAYSEELPRPVALVKAADLLIRCLP